MGTERLLKQQSWITVNHLPFYVSICSKQTEVWHFLFRSTANIRKLPFSVSSVFLIYIYMLPFETESRKRKPRKFSLIRLLFVRLLTKNKRKYPFANGLYWLNGLAHLWKLTRNKLRSVRRNSSWQSTVSVTSVIYMYIHCCKSIWESIFPMNFFHQWSEIYHVTEGKDIKHYIHGNFVGSELFLVMGGSCSFTVAIQLKTPMEI